MYQPDVLDRINIDPEICGGKPCIRGTRIDIAIILDGLAEGLTAEQLIDHYPQLTVDDIRAALAYAAFYTRRRVRRFAKIPTWQSPWNYLVPTKNFWAVGRQSVC